MNPEVMQAEFAPPSLDSGVQNTTNTFRSGESRESFQQSANKARAIRSHVTKVITSREELAKYLLQYGLQLLTSAVEYEQTSDFIASSYILYMKHNNYLEPLKVFLERFPDYQASIDVIVQRLK